VCVCVCGGIRRCAVRGGFRGRSGRLGVRCRRAARWSARYPPSSRRP
jgi:hypothetical protein